MRTAPKFYQVAKRIVEITAEEDEEGKVATGFSGKDGAIAFANRCWTRNNFV